MTLILNEIHLLDGLNKTMLVAAADRRISWPDGLDRPPESKPKLFPIPYLNGTISYFGLATFPMEGKTRSQYLSDWLPNFINKQSEVPDLRTFAQNLRNELHEVIPPASLQKEASGFHICGYNSQGLPEFWYLSNIGHLEHFHYLDLKPQYALPSPDFLERDAQNEFGWDGNNPSSATNGVQFYRNGDFRAHVALWEALDEAFSIFLQSPNFKRPSNPDEYRKYVKFKFEVIAYFYKKWAKKEIIARPIDVFICNKPCWKQSDILEPMIANVSSTSVAFPIKGSSGSSLARKVAGEVIDFSIKNDFTAGSAIAEGFPYE
jgi:hypothetical protein